MDDGEFQVPSFPSSLFLSLSSVRCLFFKFFFCPEELASPRSSSTNSASLHVALLSIASRVSRLLAFKVLSIIMHHHWHQNSRSVVSVSVPGAGRDKGPSSDDVGDCLRGVRVYFSSAPRTRGGTIHCAERLRL